MKDPKFFCQHSLRSMLAAASVLAVSFVAPQSFSQVVTLTSGNSSVTINTSGSGAGMTAWTVDGFNPLNLQWFWYRAGAMTSEQRIDTISAPIITPTSANQSRVGYYSPNLGY